MKQLLCFSILLITASCTTTQVTRAPGRNPKWARKLERPGLPNFFRVNEVFYRGAQPSAAGFRELKKMGIRTVVSLRSAHSDRKLIGATRLEYERIPVTAWDPKKEAVVRFLQIVTDKARTPVFLHCRHGADRTGAFCAAYRICIQGWSKKDAIEEMKKGGYGFHSIWRNLPGFIQKMDPATLRKKAGIK